MSHRAVGIQFPAESGPVQTRVEDNNHNPGLGYLSGCVKSKWHFAVFSSGQWCSSRPEVLSGWIGESL